MIDMEYIRGFYPPYIAQNAGMQKHMQQRDFEHLLFDSRKSEMILRFLEII